MVGPAPSPRVRVVELFICAVLVTALGLFGLTKMDYLNPATAHHVRMTDNSRSAYVAKNLVDGNGYTTNELPAFLLGYYEDHGKLHTDAWPNADRFPLTTYAIAALMIVTHSTSWTVGILGYNLLCFVAFNVLLYWVARRIWRDRWAALATMGVALLHPLAYVYPLYMKDADMLFLTTAVLAAFYKYLTLPDPDRLSWKLAVPMGAALALLFLARPNIGGGFIACFGIIALYRAWGLRRDRGLVGALRAVLRREGMVVATIIVVCLPFAIQSMSEWGSPFFSANAIYQRPLGTRFAMDTDTWYKYSEPGHLVTLDTLIEKARGQLITKFTSSWVMTLKVIIRSFAIELILGIGLLAALARRAAAARSVPAVQTPAAERSELARARAFLSLAKIMGVVVLLNFALLPLYGYQDYAYRHYLSFFLPLIWIAAGRATVVVVALIAPVARIAIDRVRAKPAPWLLGIVVVLIVWNLGPKGQDVNQLFVRTSDFIGSHWLGTGLVLLLLLTYRWLLQLPTFPVALVAVSVLVFSRLQPFYEAKRNNLNWFPADTKVWDVLRERSGLVMSLALQGEVNWVSDRRNIPAPELLLHVYSFLFDHDLEVEDVYIESAETMIGPLDGPFFGAAPGFESYARMQHYNGKLPGYDLVFHTSGTKAYPKYRVTKPRPKASSVYRLTDRAAVRAMANSPARLELGKVDDIVYTAYGWGGYFTIDGKSAVAATDAASNRYPEEDNGRRPWESTSSAFFLDDRRPTSVDLQIYATHRTTLQFYWNLDLYYYDAASDRKAHQVASYSVEKTGWQSIHIDVPAGMTRRGLNKLGFRASELAPVTICPLPFEVAACSTVKDEPDDGDVFVVRAEGVTEPTPMHASVFVGTLDFTYPPK